MLKNHKLAHQIQTKAWNTFIKILKYKAKEHGRTIIEIDQWYPSSQLCSTCGYKNTKTKDLNTRQWTCPKCKTEHDRDINAAKNIIKYALTII